jgi:predicted  nucleic acid-binding Zn ribbon protein
VKANPSPNIVEKEKASFQIIFSTHLKSGLPCHKRDAEKIKASKC